MMTYDFWSDGLTTLSKLCCKFYQHWKLSVTWKQGHSFSNQHDGRFSVSSNRRCVNSLWPSDAIWRHRSGSTSAQVIACFLTALNHYLKQCWLIIKVVHWHSAESNFTRSAHELNLWHCSEIALLKSPSGQWVKSDVELLVDVIALNGLLNIFQRVINPCY